MSDDGDDFSLARHALVVLGAAVAVLALTAVAVVALRPSGGVGLLVVALGVAATVAAAGAASKWSMRRSFGDGDAAGGTDDPTRG